MATRMKEVVAKMSLEGHVGARGANDGQDESGGGGW